MWALEMNEPKKELDLFSACNVPVLQQRFPKNSVLYPSLKSYGSVVMLQDLELFCIHLLWDLYSWLADLIEPLFASVS